MGTIIGILVAALVGLVVAEALARFWLRFGARTYPSMPYTHLEMQPDAKILPNLSRSITFKANSLGLRGREKPAVGRVYRIVMCGGSAVECLSLDESEAWPQRVERLLAAPPVCAQLGVDDVHVLTLAKSGFTHEALAYLFPRVLDRLGPIDVLTLTTGASVLNAWFLAGAPAVPVIDGTAWDDIDWHSEVDFRWSTGTLASTELARRLRHYLRRPIVRLTRTGGSLAKGRTARANAVEMHDIAPDPQLWIAHYEMGLSTLIQAAGRTARRVVLIRQPWFDKADPTPEETAQFWHGFAYETAPTRRKIFYSHRLMCEMFSKLDAATVRVAARHNIETIHLAEALPPSMALFYDFAHLTPEGARLAADLVAARLLDMELTSHGSSVLLPSPSQLAAR